MTSPDPRPLTPTLAALFTPYFDKHDDPDDPEWCLRHLPEPNEVRKSLDAERAEREGDGLTVAERIDAAHALGYREGYRAALKETAP